MDIEWLIYHLIHNDDDNFTSIVDLDLDLCRSDLDQWDRLVLGFSRNRTVTSVELSRGYQSPIVTEDDLRRLFCAMRHLPGLSRIKLDSFTTSDMVQTKPLFDNNDTIEEIWIENAQYYYDDDEENSTNDDGDNEDHERYEHFLEYLASMAKHRLRHLRIEIPEKLSHGADLSSLLHESSKLESLIIESTSTISPTVPTTRRAGPNENHRHRKFAAGMAALQSNTVLQKLDIDFHISALDFRDVAIMLQHNTTLTELNLRLETSPGAIQDTGNENLHFFESIRLFFEALKTNTNSALKSFSQYNADNRELQSALCAHIDKSLTTSSSKMTHTKGAQTLVEIGIEMLQYNLSLEHFSFFIFDHKNPMLTKKKQMFLRLNKRGRKLVQHPNIIETVTKCSWVNQLSKHCMDDLDGLYYYVSTNPSICKSIENDSADSTDSKHHMTFGQNRQVTTRKKIYGSGECLKRFGALLSSSHIDNNDWTENSQIKRQRVYDCSQDQTI